MISQQVEIPTAAGTIGASARAARHGRDAARRHPAHRRPRVPPGARGSVEAHRRARLRRSDAQHLLPHDQAAGLRLRAGLFKRADDEPVPRAHEPAHAGRDGPATARRMSTSSPRSRRSAAARWALSASASPVSSPCARLPHGRIALPPLRRSMAATWSRTTTRVRISSCRG